MVYFNISEEVKSENQNKIPYAKAFSRFFSAMLDYFIFAPVVSFFMVMFFRDSVQVMSRTSGSQSNLMIVQLALFAILLFTGLQTVFIYFHRSTPGQSFLKLYIAFEQKPSNLFFQIWFRQIGFVLSVAFLGLPFLAIIYHHKHRAFYDRFSECDILSSVPMEEPLSAGETRPASAFIVYETDKKYLSASVSVVLCFAAVIFVFSILQAHGVLLNKIQVAALNNPEVKKCFVIDNQNQAERLKTVLALNILNLTSDDCALTEADSVFNQMKIGKEERRQDPQDVSLAYFVKYYIGQKTADSQMNQEEYLKYACGHGVKTDLCAAVENRNVASEESQAVSPQKLKDKLLEYIGKAKE